MATSVKEIERWFDEGVKQGATHMIVVCDTFDWEDYPKYVMPGQNAREVSEHLGEMQKLMECYKLDPERKKEQLSAFRVFNYD